MAERDEDSPVSVRDMAEDLGVPRNYLSKTLHRLARAGVLLSTRGPGGGFRLGQPPGRVSLREVIDAVEPVAGGESQCLLGRSRCSEEDPCAAHGRWCVIRDELETFFGETTLADLAQRSEAGST